MTKYRRKTSLLHILSHKCLKSFDFIILLSFTILSSYHTKVLDTPEEDRQVLGLVNSVVVKSDDKDDVIYESEKSFSGIFDTFVNQR